MYVLMQSHLRMETLPTAEALFYTTQVAPLLAAAGVGQVATPTIALIHCHTPAPDGSNPLLDKLRRALAGCPVAFTATVVVNVGTPTPHSLHFSSDASDFELPTLRVGWFIARAHPTARILYMHTKGTSPANPQRLANSAAWTDLMLYWAVTRAGAAMRALRNGADAVGSLLLPTPYVHFSGNYWWATGRHLAQLAPSNLQTKMDAELSWVTSDEDGRYVCLFDNPGMDLFWQQIPKSMYMTAVAPWEAEEAAAASTAATVIVASPVNPATTTLAVLPSFVFFPHRDSMGGDVRCIGPTADRTMAGCVAFNTLGYIKHSVQWPLVRPGCFAASDTTGIWVHTSACAKVYPWLAQASLPASPGPGPGGPSPGPRSHLVANYGLQLPTPPTVQGRSGDDGAWSLPPVSLRDVQPLGYVTGPVDVLEVVPVMKEARARHLQNLVGVLRRAHIAATAACSPLTVVVHVVVQCCGDSDLALLETAHALASGAAADGTVGPFAVMVTAVHVPPTPFICKSLLQNVGVALAPPAAWCVFRDVDFWVTKQYYTAFAAVIARGDCPDWWYPREAMAFRTATQECTDAWFASGNDTDLLAGSCQDVLAARSAAGGAVVVRADVFAAVGGYAHQWFVGHAGEDTEFAEALQRHTGSPPTSPDPVTFPGFAAVHLWHEPSWVVRDTVSAANYTGAPRCVATQGALLRELNGAVTAAAWGPWPAVDEVVVINLDTRPDRLVQVRGELARARVPAWRRMAASRPPSLEAARTMVCPTQLWAAHSAVPSYVIGAAGCKDSHRRVAQWVCEGAATRAVRCVLVLEDDAAFVHEHLHGTLGACLRRPDWDLLYLYAYPPELKTTEVPPDSEGHACDAMRYAADAKATSAMVLRPAAARLIAPCLQDARCEVDTALMQLQRSGALRCAVTWPLTSYQQPSYSDILSCAVTYAA
jgi:GR25 family glycosyltransferase involved in LPS biosynthesis